MHTNIQPKIAWDSLEFPDGYINAKGMDIKNVNKFTCQEYFGTFVPFASNDVRYTRTYDGDGVVLGPGILYQTFNGNEFIIPSLYEPGVFRLKLELSTNASNYYSAWAEIFVYRVRDGVETLLPRTTKYIEPQDHIVASKDISVQSGDVIRLKGHTQDGVTITLHAVYLCAAETEKRLETGFSWEEWQ